MSQPKEPDSSREILRRRLEEAKRIYLEILRVSQRRGKEGVVEYLADYWGSRPVPSGDDVVIGDYRVKFDSKGNFLGYGSSDSRRPTVFRHSDESGDG